MFGKGKAAVAVIFFLYVVAAVVIPYFDSGNPITALDVIAMATAAVTAFGTYITPIIPQAPLAKTSVGATLAALTALALVLPGGLNGGDVLDILVAVAAALGIQLAPAISANGIGVGYGGDKPEDFLYDVRQEVGQE